MENLSLNILIQYTIVGILILVAIVWLFVKTLRKDKKGGCCGCSLASTCSQTGNPQRRNKIQPKKGLLKDREARGDSDCQCNNNKKEE